MTGVTTATFGPADKAKITNLINSGIDVMREIATLKEGLKDTVTAVADELDLEKKTINRAISMAYKKSIKNQNVVDDAQEELDIVEQLLVAAGV